jgi:hypothetical protein
MPNRRPRGARDDRDEILVTLVHGTWARGFFSYRRSHERWFEPGACFSRQLAAELRDKHGIDATFRRSLWSGANSLEERALAARRLAARLAAQGLQGAGRRRIVIGHSHGGNVALKAIEALEAPSRVELISLATPFISLGRRPLSKAYVGLLVATIFLGNFALVEIAERLSGSRLQEGAILAGGAVVLALALGLLFTAFKWREGALRASHSGRSEVPTLCVRGVGDEASLGLAFGAFGAELAHLLTRVLGAAALGLEPLRRRLARVRRLRALEEPGVFYTGVLWASIFVWVGTRPQSTIVLYWLAGLAIAFWITSAVVVGVSLSILGRELLFSGVGLIASVESVPDGADNVTAVTLSPPATGLRHILYENPQCVPELAGWIARRKQPPAAAGG